MRIAVVANTTWYLVNFRLNLMKVLIQFGHDVIAISPEDQEQAIVLRDAGIIFEPVKISGSGVNPLKELISVAGLRHIFRKYDVQVVLSYTPKGNIYSAIAALFCGIPFVPNISGQGRTFIHKSFVTQVVKMLYRLTLGRAYKVFFQNCDDLELFIAAGLVSRNQCERLPGSGVDLKRFTPEPMPDHSTDAPTFILVARLLWDKGVGEFVDTARNIKRLYPRATFQLLGFLDVDNPSAVPREQVESWIQEGVIEYLGSTKDVRPHLINADCIVLPSSYGEGVPRTLLEAGATLRPIITTNTSGCRDTVEHGINGYLCKPKDAIDLERQINAFIELSLPEREKMARASRKKIEKEFDEQIVISAYFKLINLLAQGFK